MKQLFLLLLLWVSPRVGQSQIPVEVFVGHEKTTLDVLFFKFFQTKQADTGSQPTRWLFFNRNRASVDYRMSTNQYLPLFGFTEAVSYNHPKLKGLAPVAVVQILSWGVFPKAGLQYAHTQKSFTLFSWLVTETTSKPAIDYFLLMRYTPKLNDKWHLFTQLESVSAFPTNANEDFNFTQRFRLGLKKGQWQWGAGVDWQQTGRNTWINNENIGSFLRHEF
ncbi:MAG TPA: hypothetical protein PKA00_10955 [Saprospiraceae bacterium]|nr:hypothetical protein [Saprospiraceae bacterium]HMQ83421.1 hypothetical protein [Saprospiraceae bacterium]